MKPLNLNRPTAPSRDIWQVRAQIVAQLIEDYGLQGRSKQETLWGLVFALCEEHVPAFTHSKNRSGRERKVQDPSKVFVVVEAIRAVAKGKATAVGDATLQMLVDVIGQDMRVNRRRPKIASICTALSKKKGCPWYEQAPASIRSNYYDGKKRNDQLAPLMRGLKAAADAASSCSSDAGPDAL